MSLFPTKAQEVRQQAAVLSRTRRIRLSRSCRPNMTSKPSRPSFVPRSTCWKSHDAQHFHGDKHPG